MMKMKSKKQLNGEYKLEFDLVKDFHFYKSTSTQSYISKKNALK